jgi:hypothetical protein
MEKRGQLITYLWVLSLLALPLSALPNRILLGLLIIWFFVKHKSGVLQVPYFKMFSGMALVLLGVSTISNEVLSKEFILALSIPAQGLFLIMLRPSKRDFKRSFHSAVATTILVLVITKLSSIVQTGLSSYFEQSQWWNLLHYKNFTESLSLHPTYLSLFLLTGLVMLLFGSTSPTLRNRVNGRAAALLGFYLVAIWLVASKIALVATGLALLGYWIQRLSSSSKKQSLALGLLLVIIIFAPLISPSIRHRVTHELKTAAQPLPAEVPNRLTERRALWVSAFIDMDRNPIVGTSFRGFESRQAIFTKAKFLYKPLEKPMNAHNNYIEFGLRYGIVFGILLLVSSIFGLYKAYKNSDLELAALFLVFALVSMTESFVFREQGLSLTALMLFYYYVIDNERNI